MWPWIIRIVYSVCLTAPGIPYQVMVIAENDIGNGPAVTQEFFIKQLSKYYQCEITIWPICMHVIDTFSFKILTLATATMRRLVDLPASSRHLWCM